MLVLSRKTGEKIRIGNEITVEIRRIAGNRVALAFDAPDDVRILRGELEVFDSGFDHQSADGSVTAHLSHCRNMPVHRVFIT